MNVAYELGKSLEEIKEFDPEEICLWLAFFKVRNDMMQKEQQRKQGKANKANVKFNRG